jgi:hypothetical protein
MRHGQQVTAHDLAAPPGGYLEQRASASHRRLAAGGISRAKAAPYGRPMTTTKRPEDSDG